MSQSSIASIRTATGQVLPILSSSVPSSQSSYGSPSQEQVAEYSELTQDFWTKARSIGKCSDKCYLDGRYFQEVLGWYPGTLSTPMLICAELCNSRREEGGVHIMLDKDEYSKTDGPIRLIHVIIESHHIGSDDCMRHSNLVMIDYDNQCITRYEPLCGHPLTEIINEDLIDFFSCCFPGFGFKMLDEHPQMLESKMCPTKGLCNSFVLHKAMNTIIPGGKPMDTNPIIAEHQSAEFAGAIEAMYGPLEGEPDLAYGPRGRGRRGGRRRGGFGRSLGRGLAWGAGLGLGAGLINRAINSYGSRNYYPHRGFGYYQRPWWQRMFGGGYYTPRYGAYY